MIVNRKDGKWRVTALSFGYWRAEKLKDSSERADNRLAVTLNKEQWDKWRAG